MFCTEVGMKVGRGRVDGGGCGERREREREQRDGRST
jgi:hypothetical protein